MLLLVRGGGSLEDLWSFNEESVARTIYNCTIPVVSGVGHEVDVTIADFVADHRAATPTAAAETVTPDQQSWMQTLDWYQSRLQQLTVDRIARTAERLSWLRTRLTQQHPLALLQRLGLVEQGRFGDGRGPDLACYGSLPEALSSAGLSERIHQALGRRPQCISGTARPLQRIGWCTGAAQNYLEAAARRGLDAFISGEISEPSVHIAREYGIDYFAAGHHATERYGVQALGERLSKEFAI